MTDEFISGRSNTGLSSAGLSSSDSVGSANSNKRTEQELVRLEKLLRLQESGFSFPNKVSPSVPAASVEDLPLEDNNESPAQYSMAGRLVQLRFMGKAAFAHIQDGSGKGQIYVRKDDVGEESYAQFKQFDRGDIIEVRGFPFRTKTGEPTIHATSIQLLTKSLQPLPEKWHGLSDVETRYRYRYLDLISNPEAKALFEKRARILRGIRSFLDNRGYVEVETPVLTTVAGGATARPFLTHYNALHEDMSLRIALELPLKKLVVGGMDRVYEIGRVFRNEGLSKKHNPEFTMIEFYQAYATFEDLMSLTEELIVSLAQTVCGSLTIPFGEHTVNLTPPWPRLRMSDSLYEIGGVSREIDVETLSGVKQVAQLHDIHLDDPEDWGRCLDNLWGELVEPKLINPVFITHHPFSISPLARKNDENPNITDRFELIIAGMEMANAFSELNDPLDQRRRFEDQAARKAGGDHEATEVDEDFLHALEVGLPPTAGEGIGIDRLTMLLTDSSTIRDVVLFPQLRTVREAGGGETEREDSEVR